MGRMWIMGGGQPAQEIKTTTLSVEQTGVSYIGNVDGQRVPELEHRATYKEAVADIEELRKSGKYGYGILSLAIRPPHIITDPGTTGKAQEKKSNAARLT